MTSIRSLQFEPLGVEHIDYFPKFFDVVFCLGILYHQLDPVGTLRKIHTSLKSGGEVIIDCQGIAGELPYALSPKKRYAGASGVWFRPLSCLHNWLTRAQYRDIRCYFNEPFQSKNKEAPSGPHSKSADFLDASAGKRWRIPGPGFTYACR